MEYHNEKRYSNYQYEQKTNMVNMEEKKNR